MEPRSGPAHKVLQKPTELNTLHYENLKSNVCSPKLLFRFSLSSVLSSVGFCNRLALLTESSSCPPGWGRSPGLPWAFLDASGCSWTLLDASGRSCTFLDIP